MDSDFRPKRPGEDDCSWEDVYTLNGVSVEYNEPIDEFDLRIEAIEALLYASGLDDFEGNGIKAEAIEAC